jgi:alpha-D-ribose 1-methylphosphonate 5-triphosphate synthase subunit PhnG
MTNTASPDAHVERAAWMRILALSPWGALEPLAHEFLSTPHDLLRAPEAGLVMLRGRMGSTGAPFNFGEATVTRCAVRLPSGQEGHGYVMGRNPAHARLAALCDALLQTEDRAAPVNDRVIVPLEAALRESHIAVASKSAATKVDFFTMVRGDD